MRYVEDERDGDFYNEYVLECTGRRFFANNGIVGLGPELGRLSHGYDGSGPDDLTPAEKREIALEMIARWSTWGGLTPAPERMGA